VSYFRPENAREIAPRSACSLPNSTQKMSQKGGRVKQRDIDSCCCPFVWDGAGFWDQRKSRYCSTHLAGWHSDAFRDTDSGGRIFSEGFVHL
jgi:hypothetical protein